MLLLTSDPWHTKEDNFPANGKIAEDSRQAIIDLITEGDRA